MASHAPDGTLVCSSCGASGALNAKFCGKCGSPMGTNEPKPGDVIAERYRIRSLLGRGAMGLVYRAEHVNMGKPIAVKLLHRELERDPDNVARFHREAAAASKLSHPNTVQVFDFGRSESGWLYLAMELVDGPDLGQILEREGPLPFVRVAHLCAQVAASVQDAHAQGVVHRDLKPENIVVSEGADGELAKVLDFGLAKLHQGPVDVQLTSAGTIVGTPFYMSPEQIRGHAIDGRTDIYSLGAIMYQALVGKPPFDMPSPVAVLSKHLSEAPTAPSEASALSVPPEADRIIGRCLQKDPEQRYQSADELRRDLLAFLATVPEEDWGSSQLPVPPARLSRPSSSPAEPAPPRKPRWRSVWPALGLLAALGLGLWQYLSGGPVEREPNHDEGTATPLEAYAPTKGFLGQRLDEGSGDVDLFKLEYRAEEPGALLVELSAIPNMDVVLELMKPGQDLPILVSDSRGVGEGEKLPNAPLEPGTYFVRVREQPLPGELPTENVSDPYFLRWEPVDPLEAFEREPNDSLGFAETLALGVERRAWIGWPGDTDVFCLGENAERVVAQLSPVADLDLVLRVLERGSEESRLHDRKGVGRAETSRVLRNVNAGELCVEVSAGSDADGGHSANPYETYGVRFKAVGSR